MPDLAGRNLEGWTAHTVAGHLAATAEFSLAGFVGSQVRSGVKVDPALSRSALRKAQLRLEPKSGVSNKADQLQGFARPELDRRCGELALCS